MCTVSLIGNEQGFIITSNRDEKQVRTALKPEVYRKNSGSLIFPADPQSGGTWIAMREDGYAACLLNGAFEKHLAGGKYQKSRGTVLLEMLEDHNPRHAASTYNLRAIEPFTLLLVGMDNKLLLRWDGERKHFFDVDGPIILSSATLYDAEQRLAREKAFQHFLKNGTNDADDMLSFHQSSFTPDKTNDFIMARGAELQTLSTTQIVYERKNLLMRHVDYVNEEESQIRF